MGIIITKKNVVKCIKIWYSFFTDSKSNEEIIMKISARSDFLRAILSLGCFMGWQFSLLKLAQLSLSETYATNMFGAIKNAFFASQLSALVIIIAVLTVFDIENIITRKILRVLPGLLLGEGIFAIALSSSSTAVVFACIAGVSSAIGAVAVLTSLLMVRTRDRLKVVGCSLAMGAGIYLLTCVLVPFILNGIWGRLLSGLLIAVATSLFVHFEPFSGSSTGVINRLDEKTAAYVLKKFPYEYLVFIPLCIVFLFGFFMADDFVQNNPAVNLVVPDVISYIVIAVTALLAGYLIKPHNAASLFAAASALLGAGILLLSVVTLTWFEISIYAVFSGIGYALFWASTFLLVTAFALGKLHPLFYAVIGYTSFVLSQLIASVIASNNKFSAEKATNLTIIFIVLAPVIWFVVSKGLAHRGYSAQAIERRRCIRREISALAKEYSLSGRECVMIELLAVEKCPREELVYNLYISERSILRYLENIETKTGKSTDELVCELWEKYDNIEPEL